MAVPSALLALSTAAAALSSSAAAPALWAPAPEGYQAAGPVSAPVVAFYAKRLYDGEADIIVERYLKAEGADIEVFTRNLESGVRPRLERRRIGDKTFELYEGLSLESFVRVLPPFDPYAGALGGGPPPRLSLFESHRFLAGGEAYRLYRCRKEGAWTLLRRYRRLREKGDDLYPFFNKDLNPLARARFEACFGAGVLLAISKGEDVPDFPKPSLYKLRNMARREWATGAASRMESECVHIRPLSDGFYALRFRAPEADFARERAAFDEFLRSFEPQPSGP